MAYATLMVNMRRGQSNAGVLAAAGDLAERFKAAVVGIAAYQLIALAASNGYISPEVIERDREETEKDLKAARAEFQAALGGRVARLDWRSCISYGSPAADVAVQLRNADLLIAGARSNPPQFDGLSADTGELVMSAGRPVLVVPAEARGLALKHVMIAWKDTRETRRAAADAVPLLKLAKSVSIVEIAQKEEIAAAQVHLGEVSQWLSVHGIKAKILALPASGDDVTQLNAIAQEQGADLLVGGAYGHSRMREWAFGGVTRDLLLCAPRCSFVSH